jgi:ATP-dependent Clp protease ATP-binding subunit ClpA
VCLAHVEADRLRHDYLGPEHVLVGLAGQEDSRAAVVLRGAGLGTDVLRAGLDRLVAGGVLPGPWRNKADLLAALGVDLDAVRRAAEESFGAEALCAASRRARSRSWLRQAPMVSTGPVNPLAGKALVAKRAFELAGREADRLGHQEIGTGPLLLGVLRDAQDPLGTGLSRRAKRMDSYLGLRRGGPSPVRLVIEGAGLTLESLRAHALAGRHGAS